MKKTDTLAYKLFKKHGDKFIKDPDKYNGYRAHTAMHLNSLESL